MAAAEVQRMRRGAATPFLLIGALGVVAGGLVSAATALEPSYLASWAVAYTVLVIGAAQVALGAGQAALAPHVPGRRMVAAQVLLFNLGNAGVLLGQLVGVLALTVIGSALLIAALGTIFVAVRGADRGHRYWRGAFRAVLLLLLVSIGVGTIIAWVKAV